MAPTEILITGGAGFVGSNLAEHLLLHTDAKIRIFDNFSRAGVVHNVQWLRSLPRSKDRLEIVEGDVRDAKAVRQAARNAGEIYHLAAQVAVTTSVDQPAEDFDVNAVGSFHVLEAARLSGNRPLVLFTSTNKVYGALENVDIEEDGDRYRFADSSRAGVDENQLLDFHSPYGCSKGCADQYVRDYGRIYDLPTVVFRMSCIAGPRQFGNEDQGWVAHFLYSVLAGDPITIYGNGLQVRDVLHVYDLVAAMQAVRSHERTCAGHIYNLGGGMERSISIIEMLRMIESTTGRAPKLRYSAIRPGDQPLYISDTAKLRAHTGWEPRFGLPEILEDIHFFWSKNREKIEARRHALVTEMAEEVA